MTPAPRWRKALRDVWARPGRSLIAVAAMAIGVFALGTMLFKQSILRPVLGSMYSDTLPASATLFLDQIDDSLVATVRAVPGVAAAEARPVVMARARVGEDEWVAAVLYVLRDFDAQTLDLVRPQRGAWPPAPGDVLLERSATSVARVEPGQSLTVRIPGGAEHTLTVGGTVHAAGLAPAWMEHVVYGFVSWESAVRSGASAQLRIRVAEHTLDEGYIREVSARVQIALEARGVVVSRLDVPAPGRHPHADQMETFMYLLTAFGILSFLLGAILVAGMIHALLAEEVRQVGILQTIGGSTAQIVGIYLAEVALLAGAALAIGVPAGYVAGRGYARFSAGILNADVSASPFPTGALVALLVVGLVVPLLVALIPVLQASRVSIREALAGAVELHTYGAGRFDRWLASRTWLSRPLRLSLRNTFARRGRLVLTVTVLAAGGAVFLAALNVSGAWRQAVIEDFRQRRFDLTVRFAEPQPFDEVARLAGAATGVARVESWPGASPWLLTPAGVAGSRVTLLGLDPASDLLALPLRGGRWLQPGDSTGVVINQGVLLRNPELRVGGSIGLRLDERTHRLPILGVVKELTPMPMVYAPAAAVLALNGGTRDQVRSLRVVTHEHTNPAQLAAARDLERRFSAAGIEVAGIQRMLDLRQGILDHLVIIQTILTLSAGLVVCVGALGLSSTLTLNVIQRTREIGILGAIGATPRTVATQIWVEALVLGVLSWGLALVLALPVSWVLQRVTGQMFFKAPLDFYISIGAAGLWLILVLVLATLSSVHPARRAARMSVREAIAHA